MDPEEDINQGQDRNSPQNPSHNPRSSRIENAAKGAIKGAQKDGLKGALGGGIQGARKKTPPPTNPQSKGQKVAGGVNKLADKASEKAAKAAGQYFGGSAGGEAAEKAMKLKNKFEKKITGGNEEARLALRAIEGMGPAAPIIITVAILIFLIILIIVIVSGASGGSGEIPVTITKTGPSQAAIGDLLSYQISVSYPGTANEIVITDHIPEGTEYVSSTPSAIFDPVTKTASWSTKAIFSPSAGGNLSNVSTTFTLTLKATKNDSTLINVAQGTIIGAGTTTSTSTTTSSIPPNTDTCGGKYNLTSPLNNFGDPACQLTGVDAKDKIYTIIQQLDPPRAYEWFNIIVARESGYNANAYNGDSTSGRGAYGLFQMNPAGRGFDNGSVVWTEQANNAIQYNNTVLIPKSCIFYYWSVARTAGIAQGPCR